MADIEKLYSEHYSFIYKFLLGLCRNKSVAEELTQETFFRAYINMKKLRDENKSAVWLCQIAKNLYFAWYNEHKKIITFDDIPEMQSETDIAEEISAKALSEEIMRHLNALDEPYKEVFMLSVFGRISLKDISDIFGKSESWARVTFYRAKQKIIEKMR